MRAQMMQMQPNEGTVGFWGFFCDCGCSTNVGTDSTTNHRLYITQAHLLKHIRDFPLYVLEDVRVCSACARRKYLTLPLDVPTGRISHVNVSVRAQTDFHTVGLTKGLVAAGVNTVLLVKQVHDELFPAIRLEGQFAPLSGATAAQW